MAVVTDVRPGGDDPEAAVAVVPPVDEPSSERSASGLGLGRAPWAGVGSRALAAFTPKRIAAVGAAWVAVTLIGVGLVIYGVGPMLEQRDQHDLLGAYRTQIAHAANARFTPEGLGGDDGAPEAPLVGDPVAIVEINGIRFRQVVVEGVGPQQTRHGPGHVPGTAGPGQPGNSVVVGRQAGFGGPFSELDKIDEGDEIVVTTTQGQSLYEVGLVRKGNLRSGGDGPLVHDTVYGPSQDDDRLTLVTSGSATPWSGNPATVVVAEMKTQPFEPTLQGGRTNLQDGRDNDGSALAPTLLATLGYIAAAAAAVILYRRTRPRSAYLMSAPLLVAATVLIAEAAARLLPAWF